jgi:23S rRNA G2445 N2-methylase RlmL
VWQTSEPLLFRKIILSQFNMSNSHKGRRVSRVALPQRFRVVAAPGWKDVAMAEIQQLLGDPFHRYKFAPHVRVGARDLTVVDCDWRQGLELMLRATTVHDVYWVLLDEPCANWPTLHRLLRQLPWRELIPDAAGMAIQAKCTHGFMDSSAALREALLAAAGGIEQEDGMRVRVRLQGSRVRVELSLAGEPLYKRGYKASAFASAPLPEHHAAACVRWALAAWPSNVPVEQLWVPFAGSGTLGFEAWLALAGVGLGAFGRAVAAAQWPLTPEATLTYLRRKLQDRWEQRALPSTIFIDTQPEACEAIRATANALGEAETSQIRQGDVFTLPHADRPDTATALLLLNPPYGERLASGKDITGLYRRAGAWVRDLEAGHSKGLGGVCWCPDESSWRAFQQALRGFVCETRHVTHGGNDVRVIRFMARRLIKPQG